MGMGIAMKDMLFGITWANAGWGIWLLPLLFFLIGLVVWSIKRQQVWWRTIAGERYAQERLENASLKRLWIKMGAVSCALFFLGVALLRPQWGEKEERVVRQGRDIVIALDISRSMLADDCHGDRLEHAKMKVLQLLEMITADRVGLVIFSGDALVQCPLTSDYEAFRMFLEDLSVETVSSGSTHIGGALEKIATLFVGQQEQNKTREPGATRLAILFSDGEDFVGGSETACKNLFDAGVHVCAVGVGSKEGAPIPLYDHCGVRSGFQKDDQGHVVISRLNESFLRSLVMGKNGMFIRSTFDATDVCALKKWVDRFEKRPFESREQRQREEQFFWYAAIALLSLLIEMVV